MKHTHIIGLIRKTFQGSLSLWCYVGSIQRVQLWNMTQNWEKSSRLL